MKTKQLRGMAAAVILIGVSGCVQHTWAPGPGASMPVGMAQGRCKLAALGAPTEGGYIEASGSPRFVGAVVGGSILAGAIGSAVQKNAIYNSCMEALGYVAVENQPAAAAGVSPPVALVPRPAAMQAVAAVSPSADAPAAAFVPPPVATPGGAYPVMALPCGSEGGHPCL